MACVGRYDCQGDMYNDLLVAQTHGFSSINIFLPDSALFNVAMEPNSGK